MQAALVFGIVLVLMGFAFAIPVGALRGKTIRDEDAPVLGATVLVLGLGAINLVALLWSAGRGDIGWGFVMFGLAPLVAGGLGASVIKSRAAGAQRAMRVFIAAVLTLVGLPGYFAFTIALLAAIVAAVAFLAGLARNPRALFRSLDPRL